MTLSFRRRGFTILEMLISVALLGLIVGTAYNGYLGGQKETATSGDYLSAMQSAMVLMESIQEDVRQMAILNEPGRTLLPNTLLFSANGKAMMFRKSSMHNTDGALAGSSFTVVMYQMVKHPTEPGVFTIRRLERTTDGGNIPGADREEDDKVFKTLYIRDVRFDLMVKFESMINYRTFIRVSITATNVGGAKEDPRVYLISNMFEATSPEFIHNKPGQVGFARRFLLSPVVLTQAVTAGSGYVQSLPPAGWTDFRAPVGLRDYLDTDGTMKDLPAPSGAPTGLTDPFAETAGGTTLRYTFLKTANEYMKRIMGSGYRGRILGQVIERTTAPGQRPSWVESFSLDTSTSATQPVMAQLDAVLNRMIPRGVEAVEDLGHTLFARCYYDGSHKNGAPNSNIILPEDAAALIAGE